MTLAFGAVPRGDNEIAVLSRSMMEILLEIALGIDVPADHVTQGRTAASARAIEAEDPRDRPLVHVLAGPERPADVFAAVRHRDTWYWIDDRDYRSKRVLSVLMLMEAAVGRVVVFGGAARHIGNGAMVVSGRS